MHVASELINPLLMSLLKQQKMTLSISLKMSGISCNAWFQLILWAMTHVVTNVLDDVNLSKAKPTFCLDGNWFINASNVSEYSLRQILHRVLADSITRLLCNVLHDCHICRYYIAFHGFWADINSNIRSRFQVSWWHSGVRMSFAASLGWVFHQLY
jgi:hypothetical protein